LFLDNSAFHISSRQIIASNRVLEKTIMKANPKSSESSRDQPENSLIFGRLYFHLIGLGALIWFLVRVVPKPSRAAYPCMRAAFPVASAFVLYLLSLATTAFAISKVKKHWKNAHYWAVAAFLIVAVISGFFALQAEKPYVYADSHNLDTPNQPMGVGQGIFPGRVVWSWNADATNENCKNDNWGEAYHEPKNSNMNIIQAMVDQSLLSLTGQSSVGEAWTALFIHFNQKKGRGAVGYQPGQNIFIKTNAVSTPVDGSHNYSGLNNYTMAKTSPQPVLAILRQWSIPLVFLSKTSRWVIQYRVCPMTTGGLAYRVPQREVHFDRGGNGRTKSLPGSTPSVFIRIGARCCVRVIGAMPQRAFPFTTTNCTPSSSKPTT
jgi:hypothetical protein